MERGWEPSSLRSSKVGYKQFYFHYIILHYIFIIFISLQLCMQFQTYVLIVFVSCFKYVQLLLKESAWKMQQGT